MNRKFDAWAKDIRYGDVTFRRPDKVPGIRSPNKVSWPSLRRRLKAIDQMLDVVASLPSRTIEIISMDTSPPTRLWSNAFRDANGEVTVMPVGQAVLDMVHEATWKTRKHREAEQRALQEAERKEQLSEIDDIAADATSIVEHSGRIMSTGALHR